MLHDDATSEWVGMCGILRTCFVSEDAFAARMCFVGEEPVEVSRLTLLRWSFAEARLDTYRVESVGDQFHVRAERETQVRVDSVPARCRGLDAGDDDEVDLLASLESRGAAQRRRVQQPRPKPTPAVRMVQDAVDADPLQELMQELMQEVTEPGDAVSQPLLTELEDDEVVWKMACLMTVWVCQQGQVSARRKTSLTVCLQSNRPRRLGLTLSAHPSMIRAPGTIGRVTETSLSAGFIT